MSHPIYSLLLDTATDKGFAALLNHEEILVEKVFPFGSQHSRQLIPILKGMLESSGLSLQDLSYIAVGTGPGSYTGIRAGAVVGKMLAFTLKVPLIGISSLLHYLPKEDGAFAVLMDAKIGGAYFLSGKIKKGKILSLSGPHLFPLLDLGTPLEEVSMITSPHLASIQPKVCALYPKMQWQWMEKAPSAYYVRSLTYHKYYTQDFSRNGQLELLYLRKTQAEIEKEIPSWPSVGAE